jgi:Rap1a immunity proteins
MRTIIFGAGILLALAAWPARGKDSHTPDYNEADTGAILMSCRDWAENKREEDWVGAYHTGECVGAVRAVVSISSDLCLPDRFTYHHVETVGVVVQYADKHPERRRQPFAALAYEALKAIWPCD